MLLIDHQNDEREHQDLEHMEAFLNGNEEVGFQARTERKCIPGCRQYCARKAM